MRILWESNYGAQGPNGEPTGAPTGYGNQTGLFGPRLHKAGHVMAYADYYGIEGFPRQDDLGCVHLPRLKDLYMNDIIEAHYAFHNADALIILNDAWVYDPQVHERMYTVFWSPVDSTPIFPNNIDSLKAGKRIWAMSRHAEDLYHQAGFTNVDYVPHGIDSKIFAPKDRADARKHLGNAVQADLTGKFLVVMNSANKGMPSRKGFFEAFTAFKLFSDHYPDAVLYCHTEKFGLIGENLNTTIALSDLDPKKVLFPPQYHYNMGMLNATYLNDVYNAGDVFLQTSYGEGFGIPIVEAQMAGCPVIVTDFSAMAELCFSGSKVPGMPVQRIPGATGRIPIVPLVVQALDQAYQHKSNELIRRNARTGALDYDVDAVFEKYMLPAVRRIEDDQKAETDRAKPRLVRGKGREVGAVDVSVLMVAKNAAKTIGRAITSAQNPAQRGVNVEVCICYDESTDDTEAEIRSMVASPDFHIKAVKGNGQGIAAALNKAAALATGRYFIRLDADDWFEPDCLQAMMIAIENNPQLGHSLFAYGQVQYHGDLNHLFTPAQFKKADFWKHNASLYPIMFSREVWDQGIRYRSLVNIDGQSVDMEDWDMELQVIHTADQRGIALPNTLVLHYQYAKTGVDHLRLEHSDLIYTAFRARWPLLEVA